MGTGANRTIPWQNGFDIRGAWQTRSVLQFDLSDRGMFAVGAIRPISFARTKRGLTSRPVLHASLRVPQASPAIFAQIPLYEIFGARITKMGGGGSSRRRRERRRSRQWPPPEYTNG